jgi:sugar-specific transcriptional regulator TrmB
MSDLCELGLSSYEAKVYRALLSVGPATARAVSGASDVPMGRIYDVLNGLEARNLVRSRDASPREYAPVPAEVAADRLLAERERELAAERDRYRSLAETVSADLTAASPSDARFVAADLGSEDALGLMREQFDRATDCIRSAVAAPYENATVSAYRAELDLYADLVATDVTAKLLVSRRAVETLGTDPTALVPTDVDGFAVRVSAALDATFDVVDDEAVYWSLPDPFGRDGRLGGLVVDDDGLADGLAKRFERVWAEATALDGR